MGTYQWAFLFFLSMVSVAASARPGGLPSGTALLAQSIAYHDPDGVWGRIPLSLTVEETRPNGTVRATELGIDLVNEHFAWRSDRDGHVLTGRLQGARCEVSLDGSADISAEDAEAFRLSCDRLPRIRNYYTYLWGLPMKLRDPGTRIDEEVSAARFLDQDVLALRVTYDEDVGGDVWYFYFDPASSALVGYRFFHDESKNDGEYIVLKGEVGLGSLRLPQERAWYYNDGDGYLGTDTAVRVEPLESVQ